MAAYILIGVRKSMHITPISRGVASWAPCIIHCQNQGDGPTLYGLGSGYLKDSLLQYQPAGIFSVSSWLMKAQWVGTRRTTFSVVAPGLWNSYGAVQVGFYLKAGCCFVSFYLFILILILLLFFIGFNFVYCTCTIVLFLWFVSSLRIACWL